MERLNLQQQVMVTDILNGLMIWYAYNYICMPERNHSYFMTASAEKLLQIVSYSSFPRIPGKKLLEYTQY